MNFKLFKSTRLGTLVSHLPHKNVVGCKWAFRVKENSNGSINRYKTTTYIEVAPAAEYRSLVAATTNIL